MSWKDLYKQKLVSVEEAAAAISSNDRVWYPPCGSAPTDLINALTKRYEELENVSMMTGLVLYPFEYMKGKFKGHLNHKTYFMGPLERRVYPEGNVEVVSYQFGMTDWVTINRMKPNVLITEVSPPDENGNMSYGPLGTFSNDTVAKMATKIIVQVNQETPFVYGESHAFINVKDVTMICEADHKVAELPNPPVEEIDKTIASFIVERIRDGSTIQIGIGGLGNAIGYFLENHKDLGVHTEMFVDSMVTLAEKGVINGTKKTLNPGEITCSFGIGSTKMYKYMHKNPALRTYPISYIADVGIIAQNDNFVSVNNGLMSDLTGQVCSESIGFNQFSGTGGQLNFVRGASESKGGQSFLCFHSVAKGKDGKLISRINADLPPGAVITTPRTDTQFVVTEYGVAELKGMSIPERVKAMIKIAHPDFRDQLMHDAKTNGLLF